MGEAETLTGAVGALAAFIGDGALTSGIDRLERLMEGADRDTVPSMLARANIDQSLFDAPVTVRQRLGRVSDVIHAAGIALVLPRILDAGEVIVNRPSLAAGNDPSRPFDVETDRRVAEFKFSVWQRNANVARQRGLFKDLVNLARDDSGRRPELYFVGERPCHFLTTSRSSVSTWLASESQRATFRTAFGDVRTVEAFTHGPATRVELRDIAEIAPDLVAILAGNGSSSG